MYALVENGQVTRIRLPRSGTRKDGRTVSNYHLLPHEILLEEGWLPCVEEKPEYDPATQYLVLDEKEIQGDKVVLRYIAVDIPTEG
jgi:hypothetical protein